MSSELTDAELDAIERECAVLIRYDGPGGTSSDVLRLVATLRATRARLAAAERIVSAVREASQHDVDCEEEGEGRCCYEAWRRVTVLAGCAVNITADDERIVAHPEPEEAP